MKTQVILGIVLGLLPVAAQTSSVQGRVTDGQGSVIPEAVITVSNQETSAIRKTVADATGSYRLVQVPPGPYLVEVQMPGFRTYTSQVRLQVDTPLTLNVKLELGQVTESVNVTAEAASINLQNATVGNPFSEIQIKQLPLQTRNVVDLLSLQAGVAPTGEVLGARRDQNNVTLDGVDVNDNQSSTGFNAALPIPLDSVQEFRTTVAGQGADQGRSSGGQVSLVTKSGSNQFHGSAYEFLRNKSTAANNWFSNRAGLKRQALIRNQYGVSVGGRMIKDRAFFFLNWEDRKDRSATAQSRVVPTESFRQGIMKYRLTGGQIGQFTPAEVRAADPLGIGASTYMLKLMSQYPLGNDPEASADRGLNFSVFRFNAPQTLNNRAYVARMDFNLDAIGKHTLMLRGTLADNSQDSALAQFPGQSAASTTIDNSRGLAARYTAVLAPTLVNVFDFGLTRIGSQVTGTPESSITFALATPTAFPRMSSRVAPTTNFVDDMTWMHGKHTVQFGANIRIINNNRGSEAVYPSYSFSRNTLRGLGADITAQVTAVAQQTYGSSARLAEGTTVTNAMGTLLGVINQYSGVYQFGTNGKAIPFGSPIVRAFSSREYEFYVQDVFKVRKDLTVTYGLRYGSYDPPYESNGVQAVSQTPLNQYFADRVGASALGIPGGSLSTARLVFDLAGKANGKPGWFGRDNNNFAPRLAVAYAPESDSGWGRLFGKGSVIRAGAGVTHDRYGSNMAVAFASSGSPGLSTTVAQPVNTDFTTSFRYAGGSLPALTTPTNGGFPYTPPTIVGGFTTLTGVSPDLRAPYQYLLNASYARPLKKGMTIEIGYVGRLSHKGLLQQDFAQPLTQFKDPKSGATWTQASAVLRDAYERGLTPAQVKANPGILPVVPFIENLFAKAKNYQFAGSATANYFNTVYGTYAGSDLDALNDMDRLRQPDGSCISAPGCNTFFALQSAGLTSWVNAGKSAYHGMQMVFRRQVSNGWGYDFNYTWSHSIDNASASESAGGGVIQDSFNPDAFRGPSDFDLRHNITANAVVELPFGKRKHFLSAVPGWADAIVGGWQVSTLVTYRSGPPLNLSNGGVYPTNYLNSALAVLRPGATMPSNQVGYNQLGNPSLFSTTTAVTSFQGQYPGTVGTRGIIRGAGVTNMDLSASKYFLLPWEGHRVQLRAEAFNALNNVNFLNSGTAPILSLANPGTFGQFNAAADARVVQFALRYEF
ncbi:MAG: carboxypeptidase regulatory-like domain-containing protein [Bryobacterales bacterium]|nr:carboxypeptidase regulatory-like domain-containing protein [Bryobacterales bacterium]